MQCKSSFFNNLLQALHVVLTASLGLYGRVACNAKQGNQWMQSPLHENTNSESVQFVLTKICEFGDPWMCWPISESTLEPSANWKFEFFYNNFPTSTGRNDDFQTGDLWLPLTHFGPSDGGLWPQGPGFSGACRSFDSDFVEKSLRLPNILKKQYNKHIWTKNR